MHAAGKRRLLAIGEAMVEMAPDGAGHYAMGFAGDTLNTAWYVRRALPPSHEVGYLSAVGTDAISDRMVGFMEGAGIETAPIARIPERTVGLYMIELEGGERSFAYWRSASAAKLLARDPARLAEAMAGWDVLLFSGITLAILAPEDRGQLLAALARARAAGATVVFDTNQRPKLWSGPEEMRDWLTRAAGASDIVLPSFDEEAALFGDASPGATATRYRAAGAGLVIVKNGDGPLVAMEAGRDIVLEPIRVRPVDSTAAGDSFNAGFLASWMLGAPLEEALREGMDLAARVVQRRGALVEV